MCGGGEVGGEKERRKGRRKNHFHLELAAETNSVENK